ncbi:MAG: IS1 family transposase [Emticicia sp.]
MSTRIKRLNRRIIRFSKSEIIHDSVIGLFIDKCMG